MFIKKRVTDSLIVKINLFLLNQFSIFRFDNSIKILMKTSIHHPHLNHAEHRRPVFFFFQDLVTLVNKAPIVVTINIRKIIFQNSGMFKIIFISPKASQTRYRGHFKLGVKIEHETVRCQKHRTTLYFQNVTSRGFEISSHGKRKILLMLKIVFISLNVFILKTVDKPWTSRAVPDRLLKFSLVSEECVAVVTLESFFSFGIFPFLFMMRSKYRFLIIREVIITIVLEACSTIDKKIEREIIL